VPGSPLPQGSDLVQRWAAANGLHYQAFPAESWLRAWEPFDTLTPPGHYLNAVTRGSHQHGPYVVVEPWYAPDLETEPLERALLAFVTHPGLVRRAAMRVGEHFVTRVAYLESPPPPKVQIGDKLWDTHVVTHAASPSEAAAAFPPRLRGMLAGWGFQGHVEVRAGGLVVYVAGARPTPEGYQRLLGVTREILHAAV
jgi:hypothetical protein